MTIGPGRLYDACCALSFDEFLYPAIDQTIVVTPIDQLFIREKFDQFKVDCSNITFLTDAIAREKLDLGEWKDAWYFQQGIKLGLLDDLPGDFLIQDADVFAIQPYQYFKNNQPVFRTEEVWNDYHAVYEDRVNKIIGFERIHNQSYVTEFMPYQKQDWLNLKALIETRHNKPWKDAIRSVDHFDDTKWFSEYELLGIYKSNADSDNYQYIKDNMPVIHHVNQLEQSNWSQANVVKFKARPLKGMREQDAHRIIDYFKRITA
jgi:hypothetical protein